MFLSQKQIRGREGTFVGDGHVYGIGCGDGMYTYGWYVYHGCIPISKVTKLYTFFVCQSHLNTVVKNKKSELLGLSINLLIWCQLL